MENKHIWYACYGSNLLKERFMLYIKGGHCRFNNKDYDGCTDKSKPLDDRPYIIPYELYFAQKSPSWSDAGVAFLKPERDENVQTLGRIYLITENQFKEIQCQEGCGWYDLILDLGTFNSIPVKTFTHSSKYPYVEPSAAYKNVMFLGLQETYPEMTEEGIQMYIEVANMRR